MDETACVSAGFLLVTPVARQAYMPERLVPAVVISASACICPQFPGPYAIEWCSGWPESRAAKLQAAGVPAELHDGAMEWATAAFGERYGWPGVFYTLEAAREARDRFFPADARPLVIGLGLPAAFVEGFITYATPPVSPPGYAPAGESGSLEVVKTRQPMPAGGRIIGYEPMSLMLGVFDDSWLCSGPREEHVRTLGLHSVQNGFLASLEEASRYGADAPEIWLPVLLIEY